MGVFVCVCWVEDACPQLLRAASACACCVLCVVCACVFKCVMCVCVFVRVCVRVCMCA